MSATPVVSPYDERRTRLTAVTTGVYLAVLVLEWLGVLSGLSFLLIPVLLVLCWRPLADMAKAAVRRPRPVLAGAAVAVIALLLLNPWETVVVPVIGRVLGIESLASANQASLDEQFAAAPLLMGLLITLVGPVQEELVYRYSLFRSLSRLGPLAAHGLAGIVFAAQHTVPALLEGDWAQLVPGTGYLTAGVVLTLVYARTRNLAAPLLAHIVGNGVSVLLML